MKSTLTRDRYGAGALGVYLAMSMLFFGRGLVGHFTTRHVGKAIGDPALTDWLLQWLAHAVVHRIDPFYTDLVWAPASLNMAWTTWMPLIGLLLMPITRTLGPVASLNVLYLLSLPLGSWSAFVLYRYLTGSWCASLVGGYLFGFSGYMLYRLWEGDPQLLLVFPVVLSLWLVQRALRAEIRPHVFVCALAAMLVVEFLISLEIFATATMFAAIVFVLACGFFDGGDTRKRLRALIVPIIASYAIALAAVAPYFYFFFAIAAPQAPMWQPFLFSADLSFFVLPSWVSEPGRLGFVARTFDRMPNTVNYVGFSYLRPVMLAILALFSLRHQREGRTPLLLWTMLIAAVLSCGPWLMVGGRRLMWMPGALLSAIPLMRNALPLWFTMYLMLAA